MNFFHQFRLQLIVKQLPLSPGSLLTAAFPHSFTPYPHCAGAIKELTSSFLINYDLNRSRILKNRSRSYLISGLQLSKGLGTPQSRWVDYYYLNPQTKEETHKESYFEFAEGSEGKNYIIGSGKYFDK